MEKLLPKTVEIILGGVPYTIKEKSILRMTEWRKVTTKLGKKLSSVYFDCADKEKTQIEFYTEVIEILLADGLDDLLEGFWLYCTELKREEIEENISDEEMIDAIIEVFKLTIPFFMNLWKKMDQLNQSVNLEEE